MYWKLVLALLQTLQSARVDAWLSQSPLSEGWRNTFCMLPVIPGQMFDSTAFPTTRDRALTHGVPFQLTPESAQRS